MTFQPCPAIAEVDMRYVLSGEPVENVYHVLAPGAWTDELLGDMLTNFIDWEDGFGNANRNNEASFVSAVARDLTTEDGPSAEKFQVVPGTLEGTQLPNHVTWSVTARTGIAGRSFRGRTYWIGLQEEQLSSENRNFMDATAADAIVTALESLRADVEVFGDGGYFLCVLSRRTGGAVRAEGIGTPVTQWAAADLAVDSQRRRLPFHNRHH